MDKQERLNRILKRRYWTYEDDVYGDWRFQSLTERERQQMFKLVDAKTTEGVLLIVFCTVDEKGERIFGLSDTEQISQMDAGFINQVAEQLVQHINGQKVEPAVIAKN